MHWKSNIISLNFTFQFYTTNELTIFLVLRSTKETTPRQQLAEVFFITVHFSLRQIHLLNQPSFHTPQKLFGTLKLVFTAAECIKSCPINEINRLFPWVKCLFTVVFAQGGCKHMFAWIFFIRNIVYHNHREGFLRCAGMGDKLFARCFLIKCSIYAFEGYSERSHDYFIILNGTRSSHHFECANSNSFSFSLIRLAY